MPWEYSNQHKLPVCITANETSWASAVAKGGVRDFCQSWLILQLNHYLCFCVKHFKCPCVHSKSRTLYLVCLTPLPDAWGLHSKKSKWIPANDDHPNHQQFEHRQERGNLPERM